MAYLVANLPPVKVFVKKQYLYVCSFEWKTTLGGREKFKE